MNVKILKFYSKVLSANVWNNGKEMSLFNQLVDMRDPSNPVTNVSPSTLKKQITRISYELLKKGKLRTGERDRVKVLMNSNFNYGALIGFDGKHIPKPVKKTNNKEEDLKMINDFMGSMDLEKYTHYRGFKTVEENLPKEIHIIELFYKTYWDEKNMMSFEEFWSLYVETYFTKLQAHHLKRNGDVYDIANGAWTSYLMGAEARAYRTWFSLLTQTQLAYGLRAKYKNEEVVMSYELDYKGIDIQIVGKSNLQVKKSSKRKESLRIEKNDGITLIEYYVPNRADILNPTTPKRGTLKASIKALMANKSLRQLSNGVVIFSNNIEIPDLN